LAGGKQPGQKRRRDAFRRRAAVARRDRGLTMRLGDDPVTPRAPPGPAIGAELEGGRTPCPPAPYSPFTTTPAISSRSTSPSTLLPARRKRLCLRQYLKAD